eukprot:TRINITY_DN63026_c0_g1_i1.p1 TRINITY_DN63026_c0_g1~~TRINITY_DN63026_c0_g1_i1.p1  ORF type:complete len:635 (+),score=150.12 TRINITY_DN63026_c0_g1_i1:128-2032(+)
MDMAVEEEDVLPESVPKAAAAKLSLNGDARSGSGAEAANEPPPKQGRLLDELRAQFRECGGGARTITPEHLARYWERRVEEWRRSMGRPGQLGLDEKQAIAMRVAQLFQEIDLLDKRQVNMEEYVHFMLMMHSGVAAKQINTLLSAALKKKPTFLHELQELFSRAETGEDGTLSLNDIVTMYSQKCWKFRPGVNSKPLSDKELNEGDPHAFAKEIVEMMAIDGEERVTYSEFMAYCLGRRKQEVTLNLYDLSRGVADAASEFVVGEKLEGIWHTGLVVFGKEYYYGKDTVYDEAGATSFGKPTRTVHLGYTLWRQQELHEYVVSELKPLFHRGTYDVITNNCNHFSDRVAMYLVGRHVPDEVLHQPKFLLQSNFVRVLRPMMNWYLRDRVAAREKGKDLPPGRPRLKPGERPGAGTVVTIHPSESSGGAAVFGLMTGIEQNEPPAQPETSTWFPLFDACARSGVGGQEISFCSTCRINSNRRPGGDNGDRHWIQYLDFRPTASAGESAVQVRVDLVPCERLSLPNLSNESLTTVYISAMQAMGVHCTALPSPGSGSKDAALGTFAPTAKSGDLPVDSPRVIRASDDTKVQSLMKRGFDQQACEDALRDSGGCQDRALRYLLLGPSRNDIRLTSV